MRITTSSSEVMVLSQKRVACSRFLKLTSKKHIAVYFITQVPSQVTDTRICGGLQKVFS